MKEIENLIYYILASILGGIVKLLNTDKDLSIKKAIITSATSIFIAIVVGFFIEEYWTKNTKLVIVVVAIAGVVGYDLVLFCVNIFMDIIKSKTKDLSNKQ